MVTKNAENYVSVKYQRASAAVISAEFEAITAVISASGSVKDSNLDSHRDLLEIEQHLALGHELFAKRNYQQAVAEYKAVQALAYRLLNPSFPSGVAVRPDLIIPIRPEIFEPLLTAGLSFVEAMDPRSIESDFGATIDVPDDVIKPLSKFSDLGIDILSDVPRAVRNDSRLASAYAERGQWTQAQFFFDRAQKGLNNDQSPAVTAARAAIHLSLGGVLVQLGNTEEAKEVLSRANEGFRAGGDSVGLAQTNLNLAAAFAKEGDHASAAPLLAEAEKLIATASGLPAPTKPRDREPGDVIGSSHPRVVDGISPIVSSHLASRLSTAAVATRRSAQLLAPSSLITAVRTTSVEPGSLSAAAQTQGLSVTFRLPEKGGGWSTQAVETKVETSERSVIKEIGVLAGDDLKKVQWKPGERIPVSEVVDYVYKSRRDFTAIKDVLGRWDLPSGLALNLPHIYFYVIPLSLGDAYHALGDYEAAHASYLTAADYEYINPALEVPGLWQRIARNVLDWGDSLYKDDEFADALATYRIVLEPPGAGDVVFRDSPLYKHSKLGVVGTTVVDMLTSLDVAGPGALNPVLAATVLEIRARLIQLAGSLDFLGVPTAIVPIWTFDYLQNVARYFAQQAAQAEREFINWWDRAENEELTRDQLQQAATQAAAEKELAKQQREAAQAEEVAYAEGVQLSDLRANNAQQNRNDYDAMSWERIWLQRSMSWYSSQNPWERNNPIPGSGPDAGKEIHEVMAEKTQELQTITREYELGSMDRQIEELKAAKDAAVAQQAAAHARVEAAQQMEVVAQLRASAAADNVAAFDSQFFTPEVWYEMGQFMRSISGHYLAMAIKVARLMQRAYNFENDFSRNFVKVDYSTNTSKGLLGADALMLDIDTFNFDMITSVTRKRMPVKHSISLASRYPYLFETELRRTGVMEFETKIEDFDIAFPGTFARRLERVEVEVDGVLPASGIRGVLTNGGISRDRTPDITVNTVRIQPKESLVLSEYTVREDAYVFPADPSRLGTFEGAGVAGTWKLEIPRGSNDLDYRAISDIRLVFYYQASYDAALAAAVQAQLAAFAGVNLHARNIPLRWSYPDSFFHFQDTGRLEFSVSPIDFPYNEENPQLKHLSVLVVADPGTDPTAWNVRLGTPGHPATVVAQPSADGDITADAGHPWQPLVTGTATGDYVIELRQDENPGLVSAGRLDLSSIQNIVVVFEYSYTPRV